MSKTIDKLFNLNITNIQSCYFIYLMGIPVQNQSCDLNHYKDSEVPYQATALEIQKTPFCFFSNLNIIDQVIMH